ncbi:hypothetical protein [Baaleninema sp.]|uniref:hypothetical protein n=1 Tax=Baaleninema sp. TaxID=3101197 RepID=UPI003D0037F1
MEQSRNAEERQSMLYFQYHSSPDDNPDATSVQGVIKEEDDGTFLLLDWLRRDKDNSNTLRVRDSVVMRLPSPDATPPTVEVSPQASPSPPPSRRSRRNSRNSTSAKSRKSGNRSSVGSSVGSEKDSLFSTGLAVGLGVNLLALLAGAYLLRFASPAGDLQVLQQADDRLDRGQFSEAIALAESIPPDSDAYEDAQAQIAQWRRLWQAATAKAEAIEAAFERGQWQRVLLLSEDLPEFEELRDRISPVVEQAQARLDAEAYEWLQVAFDRGRDRDFHGALQALDRVPKGSSLYDRVASKTAEYRQKRDVRAAWLLQQAFDRAAAKDFSTALTYLQQIPPGTPAYEQVAPKLAQYQRQRNLRATWLLQKAFDLAVNQQFEAALSYLKRIPSGTEVYEIAQAKITEYQLLR